MTYASDAGYVPDTPSFGIFFLMKVGADPALWIRLWSGFGNIRLPSDGIDTTGGTYQGLDFPTDLPGFDLAVNGEAAGVEFSISGVSATAVRLLGPSRADVSGSLVYLGILDLDSALQPVGVVDWLFEATAARPRSKRVGQDEGALYTITLPTMVDAYDREQTALAYWSPRSQDARSDGDRFFDQVPSMSVGMVIPWPI